MGTLMQDLRFAVRTLAKSPGFTAIAVLCIALGIGVNTTIFSIVQAILLRPFPFADPERIVAVHKVPLRDKTELSEISYLDYRDMREQSTAFAQVAAYTGRSLTFSGGEEPERVPGETISASLFPLLGVKPLFGRTFRPDEDRPGAPGVVLLGYDLWRRRFHGDPGVVGKSIVVNQQAHTIVGVMPARFAFPYREQAWVPIVPIVHTHPRHDRELQVLARLAPGKGAGEAQTEVDAIARRLAALYPEANAGWVASIRSLRDELVSKDSRLVSLTMMGAVAFVLLIACANVANLLLARATGRQREIAVRAAFGATRWRIVRQLLTESVLVALAGAGLGLLIAVWGLDLILAAIPERHAVPFWMRFTIDGPVLLFTLAVAVGTGLLFGLVPAMQASRSDLHEMIKEGGRGAGWSVARNRLRGILVVVEVALALVLLVGASLFARSFLKVRAASGGFSSAHLLTLRIYLPGSRYQDEGARARRIDDIVRRLEALPGVEAAAASNTIPLDGGGDGSEIQIAGQAVPRGQEPAIFYTGVTARFFRALDVPLERGRGFTDREGVTRSALAVVNQTFAQRFSPHGEVLGMRFRLLQGANPEWITVAGVIHDIKNENLREEPKPAAYLPYPYLRAFNNGILVRTRAGGPRGAPAASGAPASLDPAALSAAVRREIRASDPALPIFSLIPMEEVRRVSIWDFRLFGAMFTAFGGIALALAAIGVYGVLAYSVAQRVREIGVRVALGAQRLDVLRLILGQGLLLSSGGIAAGLLGAWLTTRVLRGILFGVSPTDPPSFVGISLFLTIVALFASYIPARRALDIDPLEALRAE
jgi:putative ABC transport system permease protein